MFKRSTLNVKPARLMLRRYRLPLGDRVKTQQRNECRDDGEKNGSDSDRSAAKHNSYLWFLLWPSKAPLADGIFQQQNTCVNNQRRTP